MAPGSSPTSSSSARTRWREAWNRPAYRRSLLVTVPTLALIMITFREFLEFIEHRPGVILPDPVLVLFTPVDVTWMTFTLIYASLIGAVIILLKHPDRMLTALQAYGFMVLIRFGTMYFLPLEPPASIITLKDPFVELFGSGNILTKDLFFSGHTASIIILALTVPGRTVKCVFAAASILVAVCVLLQHVHYTVDVLVAPLAASLAYFTARYITKHLL